MTKPLDLTGKRFGRLTAKHLAKPYVSPAGKSERKWLCECDCGKEVEVRQRDLVSGRTRSCGCLQRDIMHAKGKDLTGQRFGSLTVVSSAEPYVSPSGQLYRRWLCKCDCGSESVAFQNSLTSGLTRSCGCSRRESILNKMQDMSGMRFGKLEVLGRVDLEQPCTNGQRSGWLCRCDCGNEVVVIRKDLLSGKVQSCGCLLRETARKRIVEQNAVGHYAGTTISTINPDRPPNKNSKSGVKGVYWSERERRWIAKITVKRKSITIGRFHTLEEAAKARKEAEEKYFAPLIEEYKQLKEGKNDEKA